MNSILAPTKILLKKGGNHIKARHNKPRPLPNCRFHLKISKTLFLEFKRAAKNDQCTIPQMINKSMQEVIPFLIECEDATEEVFPFPDCATLDYDAWVEVNPQAMHQLRALHFHFRTLSVASVLRSILLFYMIRCRHNPRFINKKFISKK